MSSETKDPQSSEERKAVFAELRKHMHEEMERECEEREKTNSTPTEAELRLGVYLEEIEPTLREVVQIFTQKGYTTENSGFEGKKHTQQFLAGEGHLTDEEKGAVESTGAHAENQKWGWEISFSANTPDAKEIKAQWDRIAEVMPDRGIVAEPSYSSASFIQKKAPERTDLEIIALRKHIAWLEQEIASLPEGHYGIQNYQIILAKDRARYAEISAGGRE